MFHAKHNVEGPDSTFFHRWRARLPRRKPLSLRSVFFGAWYTFLINIVLKMKLYKIPYFQHVCLIFSHVGSIAYLRTLFLGEPKRQGSWGWVEGCHAGDSTFEVAATVTWFCNNSCTLIGISGHNQAFPSCWVILFPGDTCAHSSTLP